MDSEAITYGAEVVFNVWDPKIEDIEDHSLMQLWLVNSDGPVGQSVEVGWMVSKYQYGDTLPHLFTWFTTNGWGQAGDLVGGYDARQSGWVQVDTTIFPGAVISDVSVADGAQATLGVKVSLWQNNWWVAVQGKWIGYYPTSLFSRGPTEMTLVNRATRDSSEEKSSPQTLHRSRPHARWVADPRRPVVSEWPAFWSRCECNQTF